MSPTADCPASSPYIPGTIEPGTIPHRPGMSASGWSMGATIMSQVLVPMIFTRVPGLIPAPTAPMWASNAPTATGKPGRQTDLVGHVGAQAGRPDNWTARPAMA